MPKGVDFKCFSISTNEDSGSDLFKPIVGSRYLVFLYNAIPTVVGRKSIISFLETVRDSKDVPSFNKIESSVYSGYFDKKIVAEECAFAIMYSEICCPLMVKVKSAVSPLSMNPFYQYAVNKMKEWGNDASGLLNGDGWEGPEGAHTHGHGGAVQNYMDKVREISREPDYRDNVKTILQVMCKAGAEKLASHALEHLDGGEYFRPTASAIQAGMKIGEAHNDKLESKFGMLDRRLEYAPSSNYHNVGAFIRAKSDKPHIWVKNQTPELREAAVSLARVEGAKELRNAGTRISQLSNLYTIKYARTEEKVRKRRLLREKREEKRKQNMNKYGICKSVNAVDSMLNKLKGQNAKINAVKFQINYFKSLLKNSDISADLFKFSDHGKSLALIDLQRNFSKILESVPQHMLDSIPDGCNESQTSESSDSDSEIPPIKKAKHSDTTTFNVIGQWFAVYFENSWYPGEVCKIINSSSAILNFMHPTGSCSSSKNFKWPVKPDKCEIDSSFFYTCIDPPVPEGRGRFFCFQNHDEIESYFTNIIK